VGVEAGVSVEVGVGSSVGVRVGSSVGVGVGNQVSGKDVVLTGVKGIGDGVIWAGGRALGVQKDISSVGICGCWDRPHPLRRMIIERRMIGIVLRVIYQYPDNLRHTASALCLCHSHGGTNRHSRLISRSRLFPSPGMMDRSSALTST
jgi:hypothetical protein